MERRYLLASPLLSTRPGTTGSIIVAPDDSSTTSNSISFSIRTSSQLWRLILSISHILLGLSLLIFDISTNWVTGTIFAITSSISFFTTGLIGLIARRKMDRGSNTLFLIFSCLSFGLCFVLTMENVSALNNICPGIDLISSKSSDWVLNKGKFKGNEKVQNTCVENIEITIRIILLGLILVEAILDLISICVGGKLLWGRSECGRETGSSPYHALIYGDLAPPIRPKRIVQDGTGEGGRSDQNSRLLLEYLVLTPPTTPGSDNEGQ